MLPEPQEDDEMHCIIAYNPYVCTYMHTQLRMHVCTYMYDGDDDDFDNNDDDDDKNEKEEEF